jgi:aminoglycoside phosphotransferase (APT) family kinase protein
MTVPGGDQDWEALIPLGVLASWMDEQCLEHGPIEDARLLTGGTQNILLRFRRAGREFVLRRPPKHLRANSNTTMQREARVLQALRGTDVPHPDLIARCDDTGLIGSVFYLMEPIEGFCARDVMPDLHRADPAIRRQMGFEMVDAIAALANVDYVKAGLSDLGKVDGFLDRQVGRWRGQLESYAEFDGWPGLAQLPNVDAVGAWLTANQPKRFRPGLIHGDFHFGNVLFDWGGPRMTAMVDWELTTAGDPMIDLGWTMQIWPADGATEGPVNPWSGFPTRAEILARYAERTGLDVSAAKWYEVLACYKLGAILEGTFARACAGQAPKETGDFLHASTINLFTRAAQMIES